MLNEKRCAYWHTSFIGAEWRTRTADPRITNALLYQLSQFGKANSKKTVPFVKSDAKVILFFVIKASFLHFLLKFAMKITNNTGCGEL